jgi:hypothetical protein
MTHCHGPGWFTDCAACREERDGTTVEKCKAELALVRQQRADAWLLLGDYADRACAAERASALRPEDVRAVIAAMPHCSSGRVGLRCTTPGTVALDVSIGKTWKRDANWWRGGGLLCDACKARLESEGEKLEDYVDVPHARAARDLEVLAKQGAK